MNDAVKRSIDIAGALAVLIAFSPILAVIATAIRLTIGSPILFRQQRPGYYGRPFTMLKFRTMTDMRDADGRLLSDAERLTRFGKFLRSTSLDELPELFNVLKGEMSLVGPRPLLMKYLNRYTSDQARRHQIKPGITGWAQVNGRNALSWEDKFKFDLWYVDNCTLWLDLKILRLTLLKVLKAEGVNAVGHATMLEFEGTQATGQ